MLDFGLDDIFSFDEQRDISGKVVGIDLSLSDGSHRQYRGAELAEVLALLEGLQFPKPTLPSSKLTGGVPKKGRIFRSKK